MSERRKLETYLHEAGEALETAARALREAEEYIRSYPFLEEDNPTFTRQVKDSKMRVERERDKWQTVTVE